MTAARLSGLLSAEPGRRGRDHPRRYDDAAVTGCVVLSFWRTIGMRGPLRHMPIALCDPATLAMADVVPSHPSGGASCHIELRHSADQR